MPNPTNNYSVSTQTLFDIASGDTVTNTYAGGVLTITPDQGYTIQAKDFGLNGILWGFGPMNNNTTPGVNVPPEVIGVFFADSDLYDGATNTSSPGMAYSHGSQANVNSVPTVNNKIYVFIHLDSNYIMPGNNVNIQIDIDGCPKATSATAPIDVNIISRVPIDGICDLTEWPASQSGNRLDPCTHGYIDVIYGPNMDNLGSTTNGNYNWPPPMVDGATETQLYSSNVQPGNQLWVLQKTLWTVPGAHHGFKPYVTTTGFSSNYVINELIPGDETKEVIMNGMAGGSGIANNALKLDSIGGIYPGMIVTMSVAATSTSAITSDASNGQFFPYVGTDVRVIATDQANGLVYLSEIQPDIFIGDMLKFSSYSSASNLLTISFDVYFTIPTQTVNSGDTIIDFAQQPVHTSPSQIEGNTGIGPANPVITNVNI